MRSALLIHGAGSGGWEWNQWCGVLAAHGLQVDAPDLQPVPAGLQTTTFDDYAAQMRAALQALPRPRAVIGASLGGLLAVTVADAADALILINPLPPAPFHGELPARPWPDRVPWHRDARLASTRRVMPDADEAAALYAFRHWRDESGAVLRAAHAGVAVAKPGCSVLCIVSERDEDVPAATSLALAAAWETDLIQVRSASHVAPLLGRNASGIARQAAAWLSAR